MRRYHGVEAINVSLSIATDLSDDDQYVETGWLLVASRDFQIIRVTWKRGIDIVLNLACTPIETNLPRALGWMLVMRPMVEGIRCSIGVNSNKIRFKKPSLEIFDKLGYSSLWCWSKTFSSFAIYRYLGKLLDDVGWRKLYRTVFDMFDMSRRLCHDFFWTFCWKSSDVEVCASWV